MRVAYSTIASSSIMTNTSIASSAIYLNQKWGYSVQANYAVTPSTGTAAQGVLSLLGSNDVATPTQWTPLYQNNVGASAPATTAIVNSTSGSVLFNVTFPNYRWAQLVWTPSSAVTISGSTGILTANAVINGMSI